MNDFTIISKPILNTDRSPDDEIDSTQRNMTARMSHTYDSDQIESCAADLSRRIPKIYAHEFEDVDFSLPTSGTLRFPKDCDANANRTPFRVLHNRSDILPPQDEAFHIQIQTLCQRWAIWAATIEDDNRRREVLDFVTTKMIEAWKFGVMSGTYKMGATEAAEKERLTKEAKSGKRTKDSNNRMAPFAMEANMYKDYHILKSELDAVGLNMDVINQRISNKDMSEGENILAIVQDRLERDIRVSDWAPNTGRSGFKAHQHTRNLFMYALYEVQRCRNLIAVLERRAQANPNGLQHKNNSRIELYRTRTLQHLALALELNQKDPIEQDDPLEIVETVGIQSGAACDNILCDGSIQQDQVEKIQTVPQTHSAGSSHTNTGTTPREIDQDDRHETEGDNFMVESFFDAALPSMDFEADLEQQEMANEQLWDHVEQQLFDSSGAKRSREPESDNEKSTKKHKGSNDHLQPTAKDDPLIILQEPTANIDLSAFIEDGILNPEPSSSPQIQKSFIPSQEIDGSIPSPGVSESDIRKQQYLTEIWEPKLNAWLQNYNCGKLTVPLKRWTDLRNMLIHLNFDVAARNECFRDYKAGLAARGITNEVSEESTSTESAVEAVQAQNQQSRLIIKLPCFDTGNRDQYADTVVNETRGFAFRCLPEASSEQRARLDDLIDDFVSETISKRMRRHGKYVMIHDPLHQNRMPIGHGIWNTKDNRHPDGYEWFYAQHPIPRNFRPATWHVNHSDVSYSSEEYSGNLTHSRSKANRKTTTVPIKRGKSGGATVSDEIYLHTKRRATRPRARGTNFDWPSFDQSALEDPNDSDYDPNA